MSRLYFISLVLAVLYLAGCQAGDDNRIQPYEQNPAYWQHKGRPVLLLGGSVEDNLFQVPDLEAQLDLLRAAGGNYVRCTMSSRDEGNVWPFERDEAGGLYDLTRPNAEYWSRFARFLELTSERDIVVQIEVWATFDYYRDNWEDNPFNPKNNSTYTTEETGLPEAVKTHPTRTENNFFWSVPNENNQQTVLKYQQQFVDRLLSHTLQYGHVLYCMDNETSVTPEWGAYWAGYIRDRATAEGTEVETTEMWDPWDLSHAMHSNTFDNPELYTFVDISQNNHQQGQAHWDNAQKQRQRILASSRVRPLNNVKIYGADTGRYGTDRDGIERFWRNVFGELAAARFHRPASGLGLNANAQANIRSLRMLTDSLDVFRSAPHNDLLSGRSENEAYCLAQPGDVYAVFFPDGGEVTLDVSDIADGRKLRLQWLDIMTSGWQVPQTLQAGTTLDLQAPGGGFRAVLVRPL